ncbi:MAG: elongation factor P [Gammaproteobacteria bacterium]|jgi:elongation factor P|nr:elongation factor P [Gammaproteobacteria bacterium]
MASISTGDIKSGSKLLIDGDPYNVINNEAVKPGKGQAFNRIKIRNLKTGRVVEKTFKSGETVEVANIEEKSVSFLYADGQYWHFMDEAFEQVSANEVVVGETAKWLKEETRCMMLLWNEAPIALTAENFVELEVTECEPGIKGDTVSGAMKVATVETGAQIRVPLFIERGNKLKIDTRTGEYVSRVKS